MADDKAKGVALLLGGPSPKEDAPAEEGENYGSDEELAVAAGDVMDALTAGDRDAFASALHSYVKLCSMGGG